MRKDIWIFLFSLGIVLFSWPVLSIFQNSLPVYFFVSWGVFIVLLFIAASYLKRDDGGA